MFGASCLRRCFESQPFACTGSEPSDTVQQSQASLDGCVAAGERHVTEEWTAVLFVAWH